MNIEKHLSLLEIIQKTPDIRQRALAKAAGISLGMANFLLKELVSKGFVLIRRLDSKRFRYLLTPDGVKELSKRSYHYLRKMMNYISECRQKLEQLVTTVQRNGYQSLVLVGNSELDFMLEFLCQKNNLAFLPAQEKPLSTEGCYILYSETLPLELPNILSVCGSQESYAV